MGLKEKWNRRRITMPVRVWEDADANLESMATGKLAENKKRRSPKGCSRREKREKERWGRKERSKREKRRALLIGLRPTFCLFEPFIGCAYTFSSTWAQRHGRKRLWRWPNLASSSEANFAFHHTFSRAFLPHPAHGTQFWCMALPPLGWVDRFLVFVGRSVHVHPDSESPKASLAHSLLQSLGRSFSWPSLLPLLLMDSKLLRFTRSLQSKWYQGWAVQGDVYTSANLRDELGRLVSLRLLGSAFWHPQPFRFLQAQHDVVPYDLLAHGLGVWWHHVLQGGLVR